MTKNGLTMQSHNFFSYARKYLGRSALYIMFGRKNSRIIDYWCEDPLFTAKPAEAYDPIHGVKLLIDALDDMGHSGVVRALFGYLGSGISVDYRAEEIIEPKKSIQEEILADYRAVADLQVAIEAGVGEIAVDALKWQAIGEIERTVARYMKDRSRG